MPSKNRFIVNGIIQISITIEVRDRRGLKKHRPRCTLRGILVVWRRGAQVPLKVVQWRHAARSLPGHRLAESGRCASRASRTHLFGS